MEKNKGTLITIIILLVICIPCTIYGLVSNNNKNKDFYFNGRLYFYSGDKLIGKYKCKTEQCDYAQYTQIDTERKIKTSFIDNKYAFIQDGDDIYLIDVKEKKEIKKLEELKGYSTPIINNSFIGKSNGKWGIISTTPTIEDKIDYKYEDLYLNYKPGETEIRIDDVIIKENNQYKILNGNTERYSSDNKIVGFTDNFVIFQLETGYYSILSYDNVNFFENTYISKYMVIGDYLGVWTLTNLDLYHLDNASENKITYTKSYSVNAELKLEADKIKVYDANQEIDSYDKSY